MGKNNQIYRFDTRGAKGYVHALTIELSIQPHLKDTCLERGISSNGDMEVMVATKIVVAKQQK